MGLLDGKAALVTGAGRGIGRGIALALAQAGAKVVVNDLGTSLSGEGAEALPADQVVDEILTNGGQAAANRGNVASFDRRHRDGRAGGRTFGRIDILVNVAGILRDRMIFNMTEAEWDAVIAVHLKGTFNCTRAASIHMREQQGGRIISMSSVSALGVAGPAELRRRQGRHHGPDLVDGQRAGQVRRHRQRDHAERRHAHDRLDAARQADVRRDRQVAERDGPGHRARPGQRRAAGRYLASDAAANVNGQVFHSYGYGYTLLEQPHAVRSIRADARWDPEELARVFPQTLGANLKPPRTRASARRWTSAPTDEWSEVDGFASGTRPTK